MDQRQLAGVLFTVAGVFIAGSRLPEIILHVALLGQLEAVPEASVDHASQRLMSVAAFGASLLAVLVGVGLVLGSGRLANRLFPPGTEPLRAPEVQAVALSVLGCYFAVEGLSRMAWAGRTDWGGVTLLALGVGLFVGARGLARIWNTLRFAGTPSRAGGLDVSKDN